MQRIYRLLKLLRSAQREALSRSVQAEIMRLIASEFVNEANYIDPPKPPVGLATLPMLSFDEKAMATNGRKIAAIKSYRERTGFGLLESKNAVEAYQNACHAMSGN